MSKEEIKKKKCQHCFEQIHVSAKVCQHCGRNQNTILNFFLFLPLVMAIIAGIQIFQTCQRKATVTEVANDVKKIQTEVNDARDEINFNLLLTRASQDDRVSFFKLYDIATQDHIFREAAFQTVEQILTDMRRVMVTQQGIDWKRHNLDPATASLDDFSNVYKKVFPFFKVSVLETVWNEERFKKHDRLEFLYKAITTTKSLRVLYWACKLMDKEAGLGKDFLFDYELYAKWWEENRKKYSKNPEDQPKVEQKQ